MLDVREMVRRIKLGQGDRRIARELQVNRRTVASYRKLTLTAGWLLREELPTAQEIEQAVAGAAPAPPQYPESTVEPHRAEVKRLLDLGVEARAIWQILREQHGYTGGYASVLRFVHKLRPMHPEAFTRVEVAPGTEAQVDFG